MIYPRAAAWLGKMMARVKKLQQKLILRNHDKSNVFDSIYQVGWIDVPFQGNIKIVRNTAAQILQQIQ